MLNKLTLNVIPQVVIRLGNDVAGWRAGACEVAPVRAALREDQLMVVCGSVERTVGWLTAPRVTTINQEAIAGQVGASRRWKGKGRKEKASVHDWRERSKEPCVSDERYEVKVGLS
ncbi:hypothetical protein E2C01_045143 [Portunus trituberculatus]|uniref:Uncharacterized protein n=1 Tax=Portunus trituberculatus TaxID=210409 RepID=A0A5B7G2C7_PORTR|nr:hypothetical protein [Portunus trituberculatus]